MRARPSKYRNTEILKYRKIAIRTLTLIFIKAIPGLYPGRRSPGGDGGAMGEGYLFCYVKVIQLNPIFNPSSFVA